MCVTRCISISPSPYLIIYEIICLNTFLHFVYLGYDYICTITATCPHTITNANVNANTYSYSITYAYASTNPYAIMDAITDAYLYEDTFATPHLPPLV